VSPYGPTVIRELLHEVIEAGHGLEVRHNIARHFCSSIPYHPNAALTASPSAVRGDYQPASVPSPPSSADTLDGGLSSFSDQTLASTHTADPQLRRPPVQERPGHLEPFSVYTRLFVLQPFTMFTWIVSADKTCGQGGV